MVGVGGGEVVLRITGVQKTIKGEGENLACGHPLIHRGEEGTNQGIKRQKAIFWREKADLVRD